MPASPLPEAVTAALKIAPAIEPAMLNSERIRERFGSCHIEILNADSRDGLRRAGLYSGSGTDRTCRTYAVVQSDTPPSAIAAEHAAIQAGQSIGATFRNSGWDVAKQTLVAAEERLDRLDTKIAAAMRVPESGTVAVHAYELVVKRRTERIDYALIVELHHPDYLDATAVAALFPREPAVDRAIGNAQLQELLKVFGLKR
jgi:plasmid stabilization system protein ParE